ncbi:MAG: hypothetical protein NWR87_00940, partial [Rhodospirillales bacterium]|nr:hypothetical protein [Rhodospirillales bacterium]
MTTFAHAYSDATDWTQIALDLRDGLQEGKMPGDGLGVLYVTDAYCDDFKSIAQALRQSTGIETWIGTLGLGVV